MPLIYLVLLSIILIIILQLGVFSIVLTKLGLSPDSAMLLLGSTLMGSLINLPLFNIKTTTDITLPDFPLPRLLLSKVPTSPDKTIIAINVGGALIPVCFSIYLIFLHSLDFLKIFTAVTLVSLICYLFSRPIKGLGIGMPLFIAPLTAALVALTIAPSHSAPLAYICGTLGVLIGADLFRIKDIKSMGVPIAAIGGAGTFDGIFFTGIIAVLLA
jgi:uncharacterized membrane protein